MTKRCLELDDERGLFPGEVWNIIAGSLDNETHSLLKMMRISKYITSSILPHIQKKIKTFLAKLIYLPGTGIGDFLLACFSSDCDIYQYSLAMSIISLDEMEKEYMPLVQRVSYYSFYQSKPIVKNVIHYDNTIGTVTPLIEMTGLYLDALPPDDLIPNYYDKMPKKYRKYEVDLFEWNARGLVYDCINHYPTNMSPRDWDELSNLVYNGFHILGNSRKEFRDQCFIIDSPDISITDLKRGIILYNNEEANYTKVENLVSLYSK